MRSSFLESKLLGVTSSNGIIARDADLAFGHSTLHRGYFKTNEKIL